LAVLLLVMAAGIGGIAGHAYVSYRAAADILPPNSGPVGLWLQHKWVGEPQTTAQYDVLGAELRRHRVTDLFVHVGPLDASGRIPSGKYANAADFAAALHQRLPASRIQAWIGQWERRAGGPLDLTDPSVRAEIVGTAARFLELGFDGIHYDIEPLRGDDPALLDLLESTHALTQAHGRILSLATDEIEPIPGMKWLVNAFVPHAYLWTSTEYRAIAERVDQIAVMSYNTALPRDWLYGAFIARQTRQLRDAIGEGKTLFIGVPTYYEPSWAFRPEAENMVSGLLGARLGVSRLEPVAQANTGVAVYAHWTTDDAEWAAYRRLWLDQH
jgi:hypothetical protein